MEDVERLLKGSVEELDKLLNAKNVLGDPIEREGATVIPIVSYGFGFGAGGNTASKTGSSAGTGAGGGIKPLGAIIFDGEGARVESVKGTLTNMTEIIAETATAVADKVSSSKAKPKA
ncbi:sporulation protein YtfJ [Sulfitobacter sp. JBTF-M27]|uniref:Sporulation protein YtfJ n=1 Tax=Sulfitobacter sediminilitoris TaxID=2698830 RepID=A0A6P0CDC3_9RHOB|nr:spore germination protein GerW family protein [Sulfitobacter sediminilitoris]NEK23340.1 sporulation protein YtfJ [Sulfitobacter sediminilitoris]